MIKGNVTSYFFKNARILVPSCHICQGTSSDTPRNRRKSEFGPSSEPNFRTMGLVYPVMCSGTSLRTLSEHVRHAIPYYKISFLWEISDNFQRYFVFVFVFVLWNSSFPIQIRDQILPQVEYEHDMQLWTYLNFRIWMELKIRFYFNHK